MPDETMLQGILFAIIGAVVTTVVTLGAWYSWREWRWYKRATAAAEENRRRHRQSDPQWDRVCGYMPPSKGYGPCARPRGHAGPCAHGIAKGVRHG